MSSSRSPRPRSVGAGGSAGLAGRDFRLVLLATFGVFSNYAPMLSVVPLWAAQGGSGFAGVGAATGVTMGATVLAQAAMGRLLRWWGLRRVFVVGALLLGVPTVGYVLSSGLGWVLAVSAVRGAGFGMVAVAGSALVAELVPPPQLGRALGRYGIAVGIPQVVLLPAGVWVAEHLGFWVVFAVTAALSVLAVPLVLALPGSRADAERREPRSGRGRGWRPLAGPALLMVVAACALGGLTSFLPLALATPSATSTALFLLSGGIMLGRWLAGGWSDRTGAGRLLLPSTAVCGLGMAATALTAGTGTAATAAVSVAVYGLAFGVLQNDTLVVMFHRGGPTGTGTASTVWNMAFDAGVGAGSLAVGVLALGPWELGGAFLASALVILATVPLARREATRVRDDGHGAGGPRSRRTGG